MYRGGFLVNAEQCDYESSRELGIICPFCSQAVFLRRGSFYDRNGKQIVAPPAFAHYKNDEPLADDCELRSVRKDGEEYLRQLDIDSHNQRLDLYNKRLWEIIKADMHVTNLKSIDKEFGKPWVEQTARLCRHELRRSLDFYLEEARQQWQDQRQNKLFDPKIEQIAELVWTADERCADILKLNSFDQQLHQVVFQEIIEFLSTRTGGYAFQQLFRLALCEFCANFWVHNIKTKATGEAIPAFAHQVKKVSISTINTMIVLIIIRVNWVKLFYSLEEVHDRH